MNKEKANQALQVRTQPSTNNQPQTANRKDKVPGGCICYILCKRLFW